MRLARHAHRRPVGEALLVVIFPTCSNPRAVSKRRQRFEYLRGAGFWDAIIKPLTSKGSLRGFYYFPNSFISILLTTAFNRMPSPPCRIPVCDRGHCRVHHPPCRGVHPDGRFRHLVRAPS
jgi:hypothetical protein